MDELARARELLARHPILDGHNDLPYELRLKFGSDLERARIEDGLSSTHTDLPRLRAGGVGGQFWSVFVPAGLPTADAVIQTFEQVDLVRRMASRYADRLPLCTTADQVAAAMRRGATAALAGVEGGHSIGCSLGVLRMLYELGARYLTLTHNDNTPWADSATDVPRLGGLSDFGEEVVRELNRLGMLVDLSHVSADTMRHALTVSEAPVIFTHSSARALCDHPRNVPDDVLEGLRANGGVCMVTFVPAFVSDECRLWAEAAAERMRDRGADPDRWEVKVHGEREFALDVPRPAATVAQVADHIEHVRDVAGIAHVGIGGDYDGTDEQPAGLPDVSCYPVLIAELIARGWFEADLAALTSGNALRVLADGARIGARLAARRPPSVMRLGS